MAFSDTFVGQLQENQCSRYNEVMQALNMSAALTARKTKEFRSPPQEQVGESEMKVEMKENDGGEMLSSISHGLHPLQDSLPRVCMVCTVY